MFDDNTIDCPTLGLQDYNYIELKPRFELHGHKVDEEGNFYDFKSYTYDVKPKEKYKNPLELIGNYDIDEELFSAYEVFLHTMLDEINKEAGNYFLSLFSDFGEDIESEVNSYIMDNSPLIYIDEEPVFISTATGKRDIKIYIIVFFASFMITIFLSFLLNAINSIKQDKEAMEKVYSALNYKNKK